MKIGIVAPARPITQVQADRVQALAALFTPEVEIAVHRQCFASEGHFAGSDAVRAEAFLNYANDPGIDAIWFARGGYGSNRILDRVMPQLGPAARTKTYLGYSDMGFLLGALYARRIGHTVHGPMPLEIGRADQGASIGRALAWLVNKDCRVLEPSLDAGGERRPAAAFNLAILTSMIGTPWLPDLTDHVLMIEDVSEPLYRIDRMLFQLGNATQLKGIAGVRLGMVSDVVENDPPFGETPEFIVRRWCDALGVPYLGRAAIGHGAGNMVVPFGIA
ncbi:LD-carboxypeptidase [Sphingomonas japonica]|uniref:LD-carboxypeptidase n=1 Tax=Sphingomonas japonica TaxID=511662 RepID=UPI00112108D0|nr:LD-carboxypeptidase [Sphingomonas japonica]